MADMNAGAWPVPKFFFRVECDGLGGVISCTEVSGLKNTTDTIDYRPGDDPTWIKQKIPGMKSFENVTIKKGVFSGDSRMYDWWSDVQANPERREDMIVSLLDEEENPIFVWTITNVWPVSIAGADLSADGNEIAIETLELAHEGIVTSLG